MKLSMGLPTLLPHGRAEELAWYRGIDEGPWHSLSTLDRLTFPSWSLIVQLAGAAAYTERVGLWTDIAVPLTRSPVLFAKELATIDLLSGGRVTAGVGIGGHSEDFRAVGASLSRRFQRLDEHVATIRRVWDQVPPVEGAGAVGPQPLQTDGPPLVAGVAGPKALRRAVHWASGVNHPNSIYRVDAEELLTQRALVRQIWSDAGKADPHFSACTWFALGPEPKEQLQTHVWDFMRVFGEDQARELAASAPGYGADGLRAAVASGREGGLDELFLVPTTSDPLELNRAREVLGI